MTFHYGNQTFSVMFIKGQQFFSGLKLFIQQNTHKNTKEIESYIEQVFILWYDKDILSIQIFSFSWLRQQNCE